MCEYIVNSIRFWLSTINIYIDIFSYLLYLHIWVNIYILIFFKYIVLFTHMCKIMIYIHSHWISMSIHLFVYKTCTKGRGMCYPVCVMVHIKEPLLLIRKSSLCGGCGFPFSLSEWSLTICLTPYNRKIKCVECIVKYNISFLWHQISWMTKQEYNYFRVLFFPHSLCLSPHLCISVFLPLTLSQTGGVKADL